MNKQHESESPRFVTIEQLSKISSFSVSQLRRLAREGKIPCYQPGGKGGKLLFPPDAIEQSVAAMTAEKTNKDKPLSGRKPKWMDD